jgi:hypothetical protein
MPKPRSSQVSLIDTAYQLFSHPNKGATSLFMDDCRYI